MFVIQTVPPREGGFKTNTVRLGRIEFDPAGEHHTDKPEVADLFRDKPGYKVLEVKPEEAKAMADKAAARVAARRAVVARAQVAPPTIDELDALHKAEQTASPAIPPMIVDAGPVEPVGIAAGPGLTAKAEPVAAKAETVVPVVETLPPVVEPVVEPVVAPVAAVEPPAAPAAPPAAPAAPEAPKKASK